MILPAYKVGERVVILYNPDDYRGKYADERGEVVKTYETKGRYVYGIKLDTHTNPRSAEGLYWFAVKSIKLENEREEIPMFNNFRVATVRFPDEIKNGMANSCSYALYDNDIEVNDIVVVSTGHHGLQVAQIIAIESKNENTKIQFNREVVCRVDLTKFNFRRETAKKLFELKRDMEKQIREAQELALYEALAEKDPTLKKMFDEYKALLESAK